MTDFFDDIPCPDLDVPELLIEANADDFYRALGLSSTSVVGRLLKSWVRQMATAFSKQLIHFDKQIACVDLQAAAYELLNHYSNPATDFARGSQHIPHQGPLIIAANHPGLADALALLASIPRDDLIIVAAQRPLLMALPNLAGKLVYVAEGSRQDALLRQLVRHLRAGGCVLLFPAGGIEPDPARDHDAAKASLSTWSRSPELLLKLVPDAVMVVGIVREVVHPKLVNHPLTYLNPRDRAWLAACLQVLLRRYHTLPVEVRYRIKENDVDVAKVAKQLI
ncbi:MAG: 1-acyl-sn-glycerol-3-phosphate acyltransferase [Deinococcota bacterium]